MGVHVSKHPNISYHCANSHDNPLPIAANIHPDKIRYCRHTVWFLRSPSWFLGKVLLPRVARPVLGCTVPNPYSRPEEVDPNAMQVCFWCHSVIADACGLEVYSAYRCAVASCRDWSQEKEIGIRISSPFPYIFSAWLHYSVSHPSDFCLLWSVTSMLCDNTCTVHVASFH